MQNLKFTKSHEWIKTESNQTCTVGITDHAQSLLGDMVFVELPKVGTELHAGDVLGVVESVKAASDVYAPISGKVTEVNAQVEDNPALLNTDPYNAGWMIKMNPTNPAELNDLLDEEDYHQSIEEH